MVADSSQPSSGQASLCPRVGVRERTMLFLQLLSAPGPTPAGLAPAVLTAIRYYVSYMTPSIHTQISSGVRLQKRRVGVWGCGGVGRNGCVGLRENILLSGIFPRNFLGYI